jgi:2-C-methyl-D-erythritol 4-phosphate cytidylyltransferase
MGYFIRRMYKNHRIGAILLIGGEGQRFQNTLPKQFHLIGDTPLYQIALQTLIASQIFDEIILVCHPDWISQIVCPETNYIKVIPGGKTRQASSYAGILGLSSKIQITLIHDGVRPFVSNAILQENIDAAILHGAADTCIPSTDTLIRSTDEKTIESIPLRSQFFRGQTPQTFRSELILKAHQKALLSGITNASDDCQLALNLGHPIAIVQGSDMNLKITSETDLLIARALAASSSVKMG